MQLSFAFHPVRLPPPPTHTHTSSVPQFVDGKYAGNPRSPNGGDLDENVQDNGTRQPQCISTSCDDGAVGCGRWGTARGEGQQFLFKPQNAGPHHPPARACTHTRAHARTPHARTHAPTRARPNTHCCFAATKPHEPCWLSAVPAWTKCFMMASVFQTKTSAAPLSARSLLVALLAAVSWDGIPRGWVVWRCYACDQQPRHHWPPMGNAFAQ